MALISLAILFGENTVGPFWVTKAKDLHAVSSLPFYFVYQVLIAFIFLPDFPGVYTRGKLNRSSTKNNFNLKQSNANINGKDGHCNGKVIKETP